VVRWEWRAGSGALANGETAHDSRAGLRGAAAGKVAVPLGDSFDLAGPSFQASKGRDIAW
jgi:hypothetical protein